MINLYCFFSLCVFFFFLLGASNEEIIERKELFETWQNSYYLLLSLFFPVCFFPFYGSWNENKVLSRWYDLWVFVYKTLWIPKESPARWRLDDQAPLLPVVRMVATWIPGSSCVFNKRRFRIKCIHTWGVFAPFHRCSSVTLAGCDLIVSGFLFTVSRPCSMKPVFQTNEAGSSWHQTVTKLQVLGLRRTRKMCTSVKERSLCNIRGNLSFLYSHLKCALQMNKQICSKRWMIKLKCDRWYRRDDIIREIIQVSRLWNVWVDWETPFVWL